MNHVFVSAFMIATVCGVEWNVYAANSPPQNGAIVRMDSVRTKAYLQNSETILYDKFTLVGLCFTKNAREVSSSGKGDLGFIIRTKLMLAQLCFTLHAANW